MSWASVVFLWGLFSVCLQRYFDILLYIFLINMRGSSSRQVCCLRCLAASGPGTELQSLVSNSRERYGQRQPATGLKLICFVERRSGDVIDDNIGQYYWWYEHRVFTWRTATGPSSQWSRWWPWTLRWAALLRGPNINVIHTLYEQSRKHLNDI